MKKPLKGIIAGLCLIGASAQAQVTLQDFSNVVDGNLNYFYGSWEATGDTGGTLTPNANFVQGAGVFNFSTGSGIVPTNNLNSLVEFFFNAPISIGSNGFISVAAQSLAGNVASSFTITLKDSNSATAYAAFATGAFPTGVYTTQVQALTPIGGFNPSLVESITISGAQPGGTAAFSVSFDSISAVAAAAIPEPSTYAAVAGAAALGIVIYRRRKQVA